MQFVRAMKTIAKNELFDHLNEFLQARGIALKDGSYANRIRKGCDLLADAINATQGTLEKARSQVDTKLQQLRASLHRATAPKPPVMKTAPGEAAARESGAKPASAARRKAKKTARPVAAKKKSATTAKPKKKVAARGQTRR